MSLFFYLVFLRNSRVIKYTNTEKGGLDNDMYKKELVMQGQIQGWWDTLRETFSFEQLKERFNLSFNTLVEIVAYLGIGFIGGFLIKKYGRYVVCVVLVTGVCIWGLVYLKIITVDWVEAKAVLGISQTQTVESLWNIYSIWIKEHILAAASIILGFVIGYRVG